MGFAEISPKNRENGKEKEKYRPFKRVKDYFKTLAKAADTSNKQLEERGIGFRFCVYSLKNRVYIDFVTLDAANGVKETQTRDITNEDFNVWIDNITRIEGLNFDKSG
jgi:hypothetical protein